MNEREKTKQLIEELARKTNVDKFNPANPVECMMQGINKFIFYMWNAVSVPVHYRDKKEYVPQVIRDAEWHCDLDHMLEKWFAAYNSSNTRAEHPLTIFYDKLDGPNRRAMLGWIVEHYNDQCSL